MKKNSKYYIAPILLLLLLISCKKDKSGDAYDSVKGRWKFNSITVQHFNPQGVMYKQKVFDNTYEDNYLTIKEDGLYEVDDLTTFMFNATYCFKGENDVNNHKGIWEFDKEQKQLWFDRGITEYFNSTSGLTFSQKFTFTKMDNQLVLESNDAKAMADFGYNIGKYYFSGLWYDYTNDNNSEGDSDGYRNGYWYGYYYSALSDSIALRKDAFYTYWAKAVYDEANKDIPDTTGIWAYPNYQAGYIAGFNTGYSDGTTDANNVDWTNDKTYKMTIDYRKP